jgi:hypothetical protein
MNQRAVSAPKDWMKGKYGNDYDKFIQQMAGFESLNPEAKNLSLAKFDFTEIHKLFGKHIRTKSPYD